MERLDIYKGYVWGDIDKIPEQEHWALVRSETRVEYSGYEGDTGSHTKRIDMRCFTDKAEFDKYVADVVKQGKLAEYRFHHVKPLEVDVQVKIDIKIK